MIIKYNFFVYFLIVVLFLNGKICFSVTGSETTSLNFPEMTPNELLEKYKRWLDHLTCCEYHFQQHITLNENGQQMTEKNNGLVRFDRNQNLLLTSFTTNNSVNNTSLTEQVLIDKTTPFLYVSAESNSDDKAKDEYSIVTYKNNPSTSYNELLVGHAGSAAIMIFGFYKLGDDFILKSIYDSLKKMKLQSKKQQLKNNAIYKIIGMHNNKRYELWLSSGYEFMPIQISCHSLNEKNHFSFDFIVKNQNKIKDVFIPTKYQLIMNSEYSIAKKGKTEIIKSTEKAEGEISNISINADFREKDLKITLPIPDGTPVYMQDALQIEYVWMNDKIVLKTDEVALAIARGGHKFIPGPQEPRFWLIALGIIMMLLGGGLKLRDMLKES